MTDNISKEDYELELQAALKAAPGLVKDLELAARRKALENLRNLNNHHDGSAPGVQRTGDAGVAAG
jgi:hypothetical protein